MAENWTPSLYWGRHLLHCPTKLLCHTPIHPYFDLATPQIQYNRTWIQKPMPLPMDMRTNSQEKIYAHRHPFIASPEPEHQYLHTAGCGGSCCSRAKIAPPSASLLCDSPEIFTCDMTSICVLPEKKKQKEVQAF